MASGGLPPHIMDTPVSPVDAVEDAADVSTPLLLNPEGYQPSNAPMQNGDGSHSSHHPSNEDISNTSHPQRVLSDTEENANESEDQRTGLHSRAESVESTLSMAPLDFARPRYPRIMSNSSSSIPYARHYRTDSTASNDFAFRRHSRFESTTSLFSMSDYRHSRAESTTSTTQLIWDADTNSVGGGESRYSVFFFLSCLRV